MKISLNWLTDYVDVSMSAAALGDLLTHIGLNCDGIDETDSDVVFDLDVTSNRPDWLGHLGVARELAAATGKPLRNPKKLPALPTSGQAAELTSVEVQAPDLCPRYTARVLRGVKVGPSPRWLVERLEAVGLRSINNVVDVTNFVLMEYSQPLHSFDYDKLSEHRIVVRRAVNGERMVAINGDKCDLSDDMLVIADAHRPVAIAGIMGGLESEVSEDTTNILLESAQFDPLCIRRTSRKLGLMSDSNYRFERGVDPVGLDEASMRACQLILELAGGTLADGMVDVWAKPYVAPDVALRPSRVSAVLGMEIPIDRQMQILSILGLSPRSEGGNIVCTIPPHRGDLTREIDLIEELARLHGFDKIPLGGQVTHAVRPEQLPQQTRKTVGAVMSSAGFDEAVTPAFVDQAEEALFGNAAPVCVQELVRRSNNALRSTLLASLLKACKTNQDAGNAQVRLFEVAAIFPPGGPGQLPREYTQVALVSTGDLRELRGAAEALVERVAPQSRIDVQPAQLPGLSSEVAARLTLDGQDFGTLGMIDVKVRDYYGLEKPIAAATLRFDLLLERAGVVRTYRPLAKFPAVQRDLSVVVDEDVTWRQIEEVIAGEAQPMRVGLEYVTTYRGKPVPDGQKSVTMTLTYRSDQATLRSEQVDQQVEQVVSALTTKLKAQLRK